MPASKPVSKIVAVDWDARTLRIVHAMISKRGTKIDRLLAAPIPREVDTEDPQELGLHIRRVLDQEGIATKQAIVDIPRDQAILKTLRLPRIKAEELAGVVHIQIAKELPFPATEAIIDYVAEDQPKEGEMQQDVLVAVVRRDVVERYQKTFQVAGLKLNGAGLRPYAHKTALKELLKFSMPERVLFVDVRPTLTEIDVLRSEALSFSRAASVMISSVDAFEDATGADDSGDANEGLALSLATPPESASGGGNIGGVVNSLVMEVMTSLEAYRADDAGAEIDHITIAGDLGVEQALADALHQRLGVTAELYNPAVTFGWEPDEGAAAVSFASPLGLVLSYADTGSSPFDFLRPKKMVSVTEERLRKAPLITAAIGLLLIAPVVGLAGWSAPKRAELARIKSEIKELQEDSKKRTTFLKFVDSVRSFDRDQYVWVDVLHDIFQLLPNNEELVILQIDLQQKDGRVTLKTKTIDRDTPTQIVRRLEEFEGEDGSGFKVVVGPQSEKKGERYAWWQDIRITIEDNSKGSASKGRKKR
jgi:type IV pilus assembly protein PilM